MKPLRVALRVVSCQRANALPTGNVMGEKSGLPVEDLSAVGIDVVGRSRWLPTKETYQRRRKY